MEGQETKPDLKVLVPIYGIAKISDRDKYPIRSQLEVIYQAVTIAGLIFGIREGLEALLK